jgi:hypothetical protein
VSEGGIDVYRIGFGRDVYCWWRVRKLGGNRSFTYWFRRSWRQRSYWGIWQAESEVIPINAARGLTARSARRRLTKRIARLLSTS